MTHHHENPRVERHCDVCVVGGSAAGLAAALQLGRQRRSDIVVDAGEPRNAPAAEMHGYLGREGIAPAQLLAGARTEVRSYGGEILSARVTEVTRRDDGSFPLADPARDAVAISAVVSRELTIAAPGDAAELQRARAWVLDFALRALGARRPR